MPSVPAPAPPVMRASSEKTSRERLTQGREQMKKRFAARAIAVAVTAGLGLALTACGSSGSGSGDVSSANYTGPKVTISFWNGWTGGAAPVLVPKLIDKFNAEHDNIVVKDVPMEWADISAKMPLAIK